MTTETFKTGESGKFKGRERFKGVDVNCPRYSNKTCVECGGKIPYSYRKFTDQPMLGTEPPLIISKLQSISTEEGDVCERCWNFKEEEEKYE